MKINIPGAFKWQGLSITCYLFSAIVLSSLLHSCRKDIEDTATPVGEYYMKFKLNGKQKMIDHAVLQGQNIESVRTDYNGNKVFVYDVGAAKDNGEGMGLGFVSKTKLSSIPTSFYETKMPFGTHLSAMLLYQQNNISDASVCASINFYDLIPDIFSMYPNVERDVHIYIAEYNNIYIKGRFAGKVYPRNTSGEPLLSKVIKITEGEFKLKLP